MDADDKRIVLGRVSGVFGVRGWVKVFSYTQPREAILSYRPWMLADGSGWRETRCEDGKLHGDTVVALLEGMKDREQARTLIGLDIAVWRSQLPQPAPGEYYWADLVGLAVENLAGQAFGRVESLLETGANDVLVVRGERERLIPFVQGQYVKQVDLDAGLIRVDWDAEF